MKLFKRLRKFLLIFFPTRKVALARYGDSRRYFKDGELELALVAIEHAIMLWPRALFYNQRGSIYFAKKELRQASVDFSEAVCRNPFSVFYQMNLGFCLVHLGQAEEGLGLIEHSFGLASNKDQEKDVLFCKIRALIHLRRLKEAESECDRALRIFAKDIRFLGFKLNLLCGKRDFKKMLEIAEEMKAIDSRWAVLVKNTNDIIAGRDQILESLCSSLPTAGRA